VGAKFCIHKKAEVENVKSGEEDDDTHREGETVIYKCKELLGAAETCICSDQVEIHDCSKEEICTAHHDHDDDEEVEATCNRSLENMEVD
jgi:hypothetical protein